jgi:hypothetical protein
VDIHEFLWKHDKVFGPLLVGIPLDIVFDHVIDIEEREKTLITTPYRHSKKIKEKIEKYIKEFLDMGHIRPSSSSFASSIVLVKKKEDTLQMFIDYTYH